MSFTTIPPAGSKLRASTLNSLITEVRPIAARKTANESIVSPGSSTLQNDDELFIAVEANAVYIVEFIILYTSGTTPDIKFGLTFPAGTTGTWSGIGYDTASTFLSFGPVSIASALPFGGLAADKEARLNAVVAVSSTAGTLQLQWAQNTLNASTTTVYAGSYMKATRIS